MLSTIALVLLFTTCIYLWTRYQSALKVTKDVNGVYALFFPLGTFGAILPTSFFNLGLDWSWKYRKAAYFSHRDDIISVTPLVEGPVIFYTCSIDVARQFLKEDSKLAHKPRQLFLPLLLWGESVITANREIWRRHRRVLSPAFTPKTFALVWSESRKIYDEMIQEECSADQKVLVMEDANDITRHLALLVIARCGFGLPLAWKTEDGTGKMPFGEALNIVIETSIPRLALPRLAYKLPIKRVREIDKAWTSLGHYMDQFVRDKASELDKMKLEGNDERADVFTRIVAAMEDSRSEGRNSLSKEEVIGDTFAMAFAGHETSARVLAAVLALLAVHQDVQQKMYEEVVHVDQSSGLESETALPFTLACILETIRLYPAGHILARQVPDGLPLRVERPEPKTIVIPPGSWLAVDMIGLHHNPHNFPNPETFDPTRWLGIAEADVSVFGFGPRACIGRKFAQTESLCLLAHIAKDWRIDVRLLDGESRVAYAERVLGHADLFGLAFGIGKAPVQLHRRASA